MSFLLIKVGKSPLNDVCIDDKRVSDFHLELFRDVEGNIYLTDLKSEHGTYVNDKRMDDAIQLAIRDEVKVANAFALNWQAIIQKADENSFTIGSDKDNKIHLDEADPFHLQIFKDFKGNIFANDLNSAHGTFINGHKIQEVAVLKAGDRLKIGKNQYDWEQLFVNQTLPLIEPKETPKPQIEPTKSQSTTTKEQTEKPKIEPFETPTQKPKNTRWKKIIIILVIDIILLAWLMAIL